MDKLLEAKKNCHMAKTQCKNMLVLSHAKNDNVSNNGQNKCFLFSAFVHDVTKNSVTNCKNTMTMP